jgi:hypothetical protein
MCPSLGTIYISILVLALFPQFSRASAVEVNQAQVPPRTDFGSVACKQTIFEHSFTSSYGVPYVGKLLNFHVL